MIFVQENKMDTALVTQSLLQFAIIPTFYKVMYSTKNNLSIIERNISVENKELHFFRKQV